ncbi:hypothetical protein KEM60_00728 [Austwickia sp. TVS 96-490-7B]|uniref:YeiH family protein n=1 Tax=Austwickia sp. TVS 96-490-7B TaxID=2830843 RepID=UPI001D6B70F4|nr:putative sulfate exporter family transporter [Austwickia sp. TVS 96-490-7B]MBW3084540.1 hypothetical protein [Austwickia sp. TVS 96-490-7B]
MTVESPTPAATAKPPTTRRALLPGIALALAAAAVSTGVNLVFPAVSALLVAILLGALMANTFPVPAALEPGLAFSGRRLLRIGVVLLGLGLSVRDIAALGYGVVAVAVTVVVVGIIGTVVVGSMLGVPSMQRLLIACGFSICGAAAVAAVAGVLPDEQEEDVATAIALVVVFGTMMIGVVPLVGATAGLTAQANGVWAGASIHEVAQVVAAAGVIGPAALKVAVVVKLTRVLLLAPVIMGISWSLRRGGATASGKRPPIMPLFVAGFLMAVLVRSMLPLPEWLLMSSRWAQTVLLSAAMFSLGAGVKVSRLRAVGGRPVLLGALSTTFIALIGLIGASMTG